MNTEKQDVYTRITNKIIADLELGTRTWMKPWSAANTDGRITRPLRHNGQRYSGINVLILWASAMGYDVDFTARTVAYYGCNGEEYVEAYSVVEVDS